MEEGEEDYMMGWSQAGGGRSVCVGGEGLMAAPT